MHSVTYWNISIDATESLEHTSVLPPVHHCS